MARLAIVTVLALVICISFVAEAKKKDKWRDSKSYSRSISLKGDIMNAMDEKEGKPYSPNMFRHKLGGVSEKGRLRKKWKKSKHGKRNKKHRKGKNNRHNKVDKIGKRKLWSDFIRPAKECEPLCENNELCIMGPMESMPHCIHLKHLKKSMKKFRKYKKKEKKAWRKFHKKSQKYFEKQDVFDLKGEDKFDATAWKRGKLELKKEIERKQKELSETVGRRPAPVVALTPVEAGDPKVSGCSTKDFSQMRNRIMGWFHLLRSHNKQAIKEERRLKAHRHSVKKQLDAGEKCECMKSAMWEFHQMDNDEDDHLTLDEMAILEENKMEPCMKPYLTSCDRDGNGLLSSAEWCCCFSNVLGPCYRKMDDIRRSNQPVTYMPRCDKEGYYMSEQCQRVDDEKYECWCVDYNGNVEEGSKTNARVDCSKYEI